MYKTPDEYYGKDKALEQRRDNAVNRGFGSMEQKEIYKWAKELADFLQIKLNKFKDVNEAKRFIRMYYKR